MGGGAGTDILGYWCHITYYDLIPEPAARSAMRGY
jgi:hypothetical protein